jgi:pimeloyl-ACP methyl ester carboxylesterase
MRLLKRLLIGVVVLVLVAYGALVAFAYWPGEPERPARELAREGDRFLSLDGLELRYREYGEPGDGRPELLLIHGFANSLQSWRSLAPLLAECCRVVAVDMPGYGLSSKPVEFDYRNRAQAQVMVKAAHALGLRHPIYVGHSLGGAIALHAAMQDQQARGLVLMNPGILTTGVPKIVQLTVPPLPRLSARQFGSRDFRERFLKLSYVDPAIVTPEVIDEVMLGARSEGYRTGMTSLMKQYEEGAELPLLGRVRTPTLIVWGNQDRNKLLSEADDLQRRIPGSRLVRFDDAGHYVHEEQPQGVAAAIRAALAEWTLGTAPTEPPVRAQPPEPAIMAPLQVLAVGVR